ncbi:phenylacetate--CoA ligase family protein [Bosea sp. NPDC055594]
MSDVSSWKRLAVEYAEAAKRAPGLRARFEAADFDPAALASLEDLTRLPVLKKETLVALQRANPPFGGFLAADPLSLARIYVSPGPIFEPSLADGGAHNLDMLFRAAGTGPGDIVLNTWSYHLVPAGLLFDAAARAVGATVVPGGVGNSELQAQVLAELGATAIVASTAFFITLADAVIARYGREAWRVRTAFLGGEMGDWAARRRHIEAAYGVTTWAAYATADLGLVAYEDGRGEGYAVHPDCIVQICDPATGLPMAPGTTGEVVVTTRSANWPMIRFGTGDSAFALEAGPDGSVTRLSMLQGRVGAAVKVREIFVYPRVVEELVIATPGVAAAQATARRREGREVIDLGLVLEQGADAAAVKASALETFKTLARVRADAAAIIASLPENAPLLLNEKDG